uniref:Uncharacterized protein n=1 Tax=Kalmanozyma brasiliensis (strain GHG001) TaxID=1365824 RepID=V5GIM8_KALBG
MYPNAKTHLSKAVRGRDSDGKSIFEKGKTKERRPFTAEEDAALRAGYQHYGSHWALIAKDPIFNGQRRAIDLRDRFRNAFPEDYERAGFKPRPSKARKDRGPSASKPGQGHAARSDYVAQPDVLAWLNPAGQNMLPQSASMDMDGPSGQVPSSCTE